MINIISCENKPIDIAEITASNASISIEKIVDGTFWMTITTANGSEHLCIAAPKGELSIRRSKDVVEKPKKKKKKEIIIDSDD